MRVHSFIADSASDAVAQIRAQLGPQAVVLNVRKLNGDGLARLWQKPRIEVLACLPEPTSTQGGNELAQLKEELAAIKQKLVTASAPQEEPIVVAPVPVDSATGRWRSLAMLETTGLLPAAAQRVVNEMRALHGDEPPASLAEELALAKQVLHTQWRQHPTPASGVHIFIGTPGSGKTTVLSKWLAQSVLVEEKSACVWRLDGRTANTAEALSVYCEILGVPVERSFQLDSRMQQAEMMFIDLPGVNWADAAAVGDLARQLNRFPRCHVHLVLNLAYEVPTLLKQVRAFASVPFSDLIFTHLDEEPRWGKIWNFVLGTNYCVGFGSAGQNVPGDFFRATAEQVLARQFSRK
jgi:flagellar biosynthesis protein FlhF